MAAVVVTVVVKVVEDVAALVVEVVVAAVVPVVECDVIEGSAGLESSFISAGIAANPPITRSDARPKQSLKAIPPAEAAEPPLVAACRAARIFASSAESAV